MADTGAGPRLMERGAQENTVFSPQREYRSQPERGGLGDFSGWRMQASYGEEQPSAGLKKTGSCLRKLEEPAAGWEPL